MELWEKLKTQNVHVALQENTNTCTSNSSTLEPKKQQKMPLQSKYTYTCMNADTGILSFHYLQQPQQKRGAGHVEDVWLLIAVYVYTAKISGNLEVLDARKRAVYKENVYFYPLVKQAQ